MPKPGENVSDTDPIITEKTLSDKDVTISLTSYAYDGTAKTPAVTVKVGNTTLKAGTDYTIEYKNNTNAGTATVTVTGKGNYKGTVKIGGMTFKVTAIANNAFKKNAKITSVEIGDNVKTIGTSAFKDTAKVKVPSKKLSAYKNIFKNKGQGKKVKITK